MDKKLQPLSKTQLQKHNAMFKDVFGLLGTKDLRGHALVWVDLVLNPECNDAQKLAFEKTDSDNDGKLSKAEGEQFWAGMFEIGGGTDGVTFDDE